MIVIERKRDSGKTTMLLHYMVCNLNSIYVARTEESAKRASIKAQGLGLGLPPGRFKGMCDRDIKIAYDHGYKILVDDVDYIIKRHPELGYNLIAIANIITVSKGEL